MRCLPAAAAVSISGILQANPPHSSSPPSPSCTIARRSCPCCCCYCRCLQPSLSPHPRLSPFVSHPLSMAKTYPHAPSTSTSPSLAALTHTPTAQGSCCWMERRCISHATCRVSHVTCHTSHEASNRGTCHTSQVHIHAHFFKLPPLLPSPLPPSPVLRFHCQ